MGAQTPWPTDFAELKKLEDILQCPICYEYINTCMITSCSHNFCSLCIRKYLQFKTQCPTCFEETHGSDLRKNRLIDDIVNIYVKIKDRLLFTLRLVAMTQSVKNESKQNNETDSPSVSKESDSIKKEMKTPKNERSKKPVVQKLFSEKKSSLENNEVKPIVVDGVVIPSMFQPQKSPKKAISKSSLDMSTCPVCNVDIPLKNVNMHLDSCLAASDPEPRHKPKPEKREPIPKRVYTMMKDKEIKRYLKDYGLSTNGDRKAMISRISRYVVIYNAECDKEYPRPVSELVKQIEREEKDEKAIQSNPLFQTTRPPVIPPEKKKDPEAIEKMNKDYLDLNRDNFKKLIEAMRQRDGKNIKPLKPLNRIDSEDESETKPPISIDQIPSTSRENNDLDTISIYSQDTVADSDSDPDMIEKTPVKVEKEVHRPGLIDWAKTEAKDDLPSEKQSPEHEMNKTVISSFADDSDSYESVFNTSTRSDLSKTPTNKTPSRRKFKLRTPPEQSPSVKMAEKLDELFDGEAGVALTNGKSHHMNRDHEEEGEEDEDEDEDESDVSSVVTPHKEYDVSPEISPMKTRSAKRKCFERSASKTSVSHGKRVKPSASPEY